MDQNLIDTYFPEAGSIPAADLRLAREQVVAYLRPVFSDEDLAPGSVVGDSVVSILAHWLAARRISMDRFTSDLDPANVADNVIWSCPFVERYLDNFGVYDVDNLTGGGRVRLLFDREQTFVFDRSTTFRFNSDDLFTPHLNEKDELRVVSADDPDAPDTYRLSRIGTDRWAVDIPVTGFPSEPVASGSRGEINETQTGLVGIQSVGVMNTGMPPDSLPDLARRTRQTAWAATPSASEGARAMVRRLWPETASIEVVSTGQAEMLRSVAGTAMALPSAATDLIFRSKQDLTRETQVVRLDFDPALQEFRARLDLLHRPSLINRIEWVGQTDLELSDGVYLYARTPDRQGSLYLGSRDEELWLRLVPPETGGVLDIDRRQDAQGLYAFFRIDYFCDPALDAVARTLESDAYRPAGTDLLVRSGALGQITSLSIPYVRRSGSRVNLSAARDDILERVNRGTGWSGTGDLAEIMKVAGAESVGAIGMTGVIRQSPAVRRFDPSYDPAADTSWQANSSPIRTWTIGSPDDLSETRVFSGVYEGADDAWAVGTGLRPFVEAKSVKFKETIT